MCIRDRSHGHYDHADGLRRFFQLNQRAKVYVRPQAGGPYFSMTEEGPKFIGVHRDIWEGARERLVPVPGPMELLEGGWLLPDGPKDPAFMGKASNLVCKRGEDDFVPDDFSHEQSLVLEGERGLVVFNSCSHGGIVNIVRGVLDQLPGKRVHAVVGGLHMYAKGGTGMNCSPEYVQSVADALKALHMVYLVYLLEQKYGITFNDSDMDDTAFYTVNGISDIICDRLYSDL